MYRLATIFFITINIFIIESNYGQTKTRILNEGYSRKECFENSIFLLDEEKSQIQSYKDYEQYEIFSDSMSLLCRISKLEESYFDISYYGFSDDPGVTQENLSDEGGLLVSFFYDERKLKFNEIPSVSRGFLECDGRRAVYGGLNMVWTRQKGMSYDAYKAIYEYSKNINVIDIIEEFIFFQMKSICVDQINVFDSIGGNETGNLVMGDLVEILHEESDWVKIKSLKTGLTGWIYDSCLE